MRLNSPIWLVIFVLLANAEVAWGADPVEVTSATTSAFSTVALEPVPGFQLFQDRDDCLEPTGCAAQASVSGSLEGSSGSGSGRASSTISLGEGEPALVASGQFVAHMTASAAPGTQIARAGASASVEFNFTTSRPMFVDIRWSADLSGVSDDAWHSALQSPGNPRQIYGATIADSGNLGTPQFAGEIPAGDYFFSFGGSGGVNTCNPPVDGSETCVDPPVQSATTSGTFTLTLSDSPGSVVRWINPAGGSWDDETNWEPQQVPGLSDTAVFDLPNSYAVDFPAALTPLGVAPPAVGATCASTRSVQATVLREGTTTFTGGDVSTLADSPGQPGLQVGGASPSAAAKLQLLSGELCSIFATLGGGSGRGEVELLGGVWNNAARLRVGDSGPGRLVISRAAVRAAETRVGRVAGGEVLVEGPIPDGVLVNLEAGALLVGSEEFPETGGVRSTVQLVGGAGMISGAALIAGGRCLVESQRTECAEVRVAENSAWLNTESIDVGGGPFVDDAGVDREAVGHGSLVVESGGQVSSGLVTIANDEFELGPDEPSSDILSFGYVEVTGAGSGLFSPGITVANGGVGTLSIREGGVVETNSFPDAVFVGAGLNGLGFVDISGREGDQVSTLRTRVLRIASPRAIVSLFGGDGRIEASETIIVEGRLEGSGTVVTPVFDARPGSTIAPAITLASAASDTFARFASRDFSARSRITSRPAALGATAPPAGLVIEGDVIFHPGATLEIAASGPGQCPTLQVGGNATLGGTLELVFHGGYTPAAGEACDVLTVNGTTTGRFDRVSVRGVAEGFRYQAEPAGGGAIAFVALSDAGPCGAGDTNGDGVANCERCDNCVDDTGDGLTDRADPDCAAPADGGGVGLGDPSLAKPLLRCHAGLARASKLLVGKTLTSFQKCADAVQKCHQQKPDDSRCVEAAAIRCAKAAAKLEGPSGVRTKAAAKIEKACGDVPLDAVLASSGLGYGSEGAACAAVGVPELRSAADLATCAVERQLCAAGEWFGASLPRGAELLGDAGVADALPCLRTTTDAAGAGLGDAKGAGPRAVACQRAINKMGTKLLTQALDTEARCTGAVLACLQTKPRDEGCLAKASSACGKREAKLARAQDRLRASLTTRCGDPADLLAASGLGFAGAELRCRELGVESLDSQNAVAQCLIAENVCRASQLGDGVLPRAAELLTLQGEQ